MHLPGGLRRRLHMPRGTTLFRILASQTAIGLGGLVSALGFVLFQMPFKLAAGGVGGLGLIVHEWTGFSPGLFFLLANIPLLILGFFTLGRWRFLFQTVTAVLTFSLGADLFARYLPGFFSNYPLTDDALLSGIYAGIVGGVGMGILYRAGGSIGGTSIPARLLNMKTGFPLSQAFLYTDTGIILLAGVVFSWEAAMLAFLTLMLMGMVSDTIMEGVSQVRTGTIITSKPDAMRKELMFTLQRGVSLWSVTGGYTDTARTMLFCTVRRSQVGDLRHTVYGVDPDAFLVVGIAQQAWGGFGLSRSKKPEPLPPDAAERMGSPGLGPSELSEAPPPGGD